MDPKKKNPKDTQKAFLYRHTEESSSSSSSSSSSTISPDNTQELNNKNSTKSFDLHHQQSSTINSDSLTASSASETDDMKRAIAKKLIERYFYQLSDGCGNPKCSNKNCASSGEVENLSPNQAAARAIQLYSEEAELCELHPSKIPRTNVETCTNHDSESRYFFFLN